jgi:rRNA maturation protein Nop10
MHAVYKPGSAPYEYNFEEYCPHCDSSIPVVIDNDEMDSYDTVCPVCGNELMLCTLCMWDQEGTGEDAPGDCDFHDGKCFRRK